MAAALTLEPQIERLSHDLAKVRDVLYLGRGTSFPIALEGALKLKEISYIHAEGYAAGELKHGPIALIDETMPVIVIAPYDRVFEKTVSNMQEVAARGGKIILVTDPQGAKEATIESVETLTLPEMASTVTPLVYAIPVQLIAYHTAAAIGTDVDQPRNLREIGHGGIGADIMTELDQSGGAPTPVETTKVVASQTSFAGRVRNYFLTGLVVAGPLAITVWLIWSIITWADDFVRPLIPPAYRPESYLPWPIPGTGLIISFVVLTLLGFLTANLVGRTLVELGEGLLNRMPIVRPVYNTMKQIFESLFSKTGSSFRKVALVEFPAPGMWSLVLLSQSPSADLAKKLPPGEYVSAFMPCTPNPTTGFFFLR